MKSAWLICLFFVPWLALAQTPSATPPAAGARTGTISGRVLGEDGAPAAFVSVQAFMVGAGASTSRTTLTDAEGNFGWRDLPAGSYRLSTYLPGYVASENYLENTYRLGDTVTLNLVKGGVITGRVTTGAGEPVVAVQVNALRVRDIEGKPVPPAQGGRPAFTDDNGVYRLYGLRAGSYLVVANAQGGGVTSFASAFDGDAPVYYPSATRDTASEVQVQFGSVVSGIDLRYRSEPGHVISGKVAGIIEAGNTNFIPSVMLALRQTSTGQQVISGTSLAQAGAAVFELRGVPDGDYEISASRFDRANGATSLWRRVQVRGANVTGLELTLAPLASVSGRVVLEAEPAATGVTPAPKCVPQRPASLEEVLLRLQRDEGKPGEAPNLSFSSAEAAPDSKGAFTLNNVQAGRYRLLFNLPSENWYAKAIATGNAAPAPTPTATNRRTPAAVSAGAAPMFTLKSGERLSGLTVTLGTGAASLRGQVTGDRAKAAARLRVHLIPADAAAAEDVLRYAELPLRNDGSFHFKHLAPGKYWLLTRPLGEDESSERPTRPLAWDAAERAKLRREAEAAKQEVELAACQSLTDFKLPYPASRGR